METMKKVRVSVSDYSQIVVAIVVMAVYAWWYGQGPWDGGRFA